MTEFNFGTWEAPEKVNPYTELIAAFVKASDENPNAAYTLTTGADTHANDVAKFRKAANDAGKTARIRATSVDKKASTASTTFTLTKRHKARNTGKKASGE